MKSAVVVTGSAGGIGSAICERARRDGFITIGLDRTASQAADIDRIVDLRDQGRLEELGCELAGDFDLKALIHNAAVQPVAKAGKISQEEWSDAFLVNVVAIDALVSGTQRSLSANEGSVVVVSSVHSRATTGGITAYATTKAATEGWVRSAALDLAPDIRVNAIAPGAIDTAKLREGFARWGDSAEARKEVLLERTPLRRIGQPSDVAGAVAFLIGKDARFITGTCLVVDGGATVRLGSE